MKVGDLVKCCHTGYMGIIAKSHRTLKKHPLQFWVEWIQGHAPQWVLERDLEAV
jgi:thiaminase